MTDIGILITACITNSACRMLAQKEISVHDTDALFGRLNGFSELGIFGTADAIGTDKLLAACTPPLQADDFLKTMVSKGMLGSKTPDAGGFYKIKDGKKLVLSADDFSHIEYTEDNQPAEAASTSLALRQRALFFGSSVKAVWEIISDLFSFAAGMIPEQSGSIAEIDHAVRTDCGWLTGPFELWETIGLWPVLERLKNENRPVPANAQKMLICGAERFYKINDGKKQYFHFDSRAHKNIPDSFL
ncbi:MAG: hypothetical protein FWG92_00770 [Leptospirales bacterium]|nr:hypothetical protein [Leptospirales bacterium]